MIRTPSDLVAYLKAVALAHPAVKLVITGEDLRNEERTLSQAEYPCADIDTPQHTIPIGDGPARLSTRMFFYHVNPGGKEEQQDVLLTMTHRIATSVCAIIKMHTEDDDYGITLAEDFVIEPRLHYTSDNVCGWMVPITIEVDQEICKSNDIDVTTVVFPQFRWTAEMDKDNPIGGEITLEDTSIVEDPEQITFYWQEKLEQPQPAALDEDTIELGIILDTGMTHRIVNVWIRIEANATVYYAYAEIDTRISSGWSTPYVPYLPTNP